MQNIQSVVVLALFERNGKALLTRRRNNVTWEPNKWGFPGGKLEFGEEPEAALKREIKEELGVNITVGKLICVHTHLYELPDKRLHVVLLVYKADTPEEPQALEDAALEWVAKEKVKSYDLVAGNVKLIDLCLGIANNTDHGSR